jgi:hypothetical protein
MRSSRGARTVEERRNRSEAGRNRYRLERTQFIENPRAKVFQFFSQVENLERITPSFLGFEILTTPPVLVEPGSLFDYRRDSISRLLGAGKPPAGH